MPLRQSIRGVGVGAALLLLLASPGGAKTIAPGMPSAARHHGNFDVLRAVTTAGAYGVITSVLRSAAHNRAVGGVRNSYHLRGQAIDVARRPGVSHQAVQSALLRAGLQIIESLDEGDHSHFAFAARETYSASGARPAAPLRSSRSVASAKPAPPVLAADNHGSLLVTGARLINDGPKFGSEAPGP